MATILQLPTSPRTKVYRAIDNALRRDPVLSSVVKADSFRSWSGKGKDTTEFTYSMAPAIRLTPMNGPEQFAFPSAMKGWLYINVEMLLTGTDYDDVMNLWWALELALYTQGVPQALNAAGAYSGLCLFSQPAFDPSPADRYFAATGQIKIEVLLQLTGNGTP